MFSRLLNLYELAHCQLNHLNYLGAGAHRNVAVPRGSRILCAVNEKNETNRQ
jgi:hypothetical protein